MTPPPAGFGIEPWTVTLGMDQPEEVEVVIPMTAPPWNQGKMKKLRTLRQTGRVQPACKRSEPGPLLLLLGQIKSVNTSGLLLAVELSPRLEGTFFYSPVLTQGFTVTSLWRREVKSLCPVTPPPSQ